MNFITSLIPLNVTEQNVINQTTPLIHSAMKSSLRVFIKHPFITSGVIIGVILLIGTVFSLMFDRGEGKMQNILWSATVHIIVIFITFMALVLFDFGEFMIFN